MLELQSAQQSLYSSPSRIFLFATLHGENLWARACWPPCRRKGKKTRHTRSFSNHVADPPRFKQLFFPCPPRAPFSAIGVRQEQISKGGHSATQS